MIRAGAVCGLSLILAACGGDGIGAGGAGGRALYLENCAVCHGPDGRGDGVIAGQLPVAPADLTGLAARNGGAFPWSDVMANVHGYQGRVDIMPEFGTVLAGPTVMWRDERGRRIETPVALLSSARYLDVIQQ